MNAIDLNISERAVELRRNFDRSFVEAVHVETIATEDFLSIHVAGDRYVLRLVEIAGLFADRKVTPLPSRIAELRGVAGFRGAMVPIYDLAALLGYPLSADARWMAVAAGNGVGLAFDSFDGHFRAPSATVASRSESESREHVRQILRAEDGPRSIIDIPSIISAIGKRIPEAAAKKEH